MEIKGKVHCFFEQSGTFKNEFKKLGIPAEDYDIQDNFGETDHKVDLFAAIDDAWDGKPSLFDGIVKDDFVLAFFPCVYFCESSQLAFSIWYFNYRKLDDAGRIEKILEREKNRDRFYSLLVKLVGVCLTRGLKLVVENPWTFPSFLMNNFLKEPDVIDMDRTLRGDFFRKPTAFWFFGCEPTSGRTVQKTPKERIRTIRKSRSGAMAGVCSEERSMISPDYARNFICDFILGKTQEGMLKQPELDFGNQGAKRHG